MGIRHYIIRDTEISGKSSINYISYETLVLPLTGGTLTGGLIGPSVSATTFSGGTFHGDGSNLINIPDNFVTGGTLSTGGTLTLTRNDDADITVTGFTSDGGGTFGSEYHFGKSDGESSTTSNIFQQKLRVTTSSLPSGTYRIGYTCEVRTTDEDMNIRVQINDTTTIAQFEHSQGSDGDDAISYWALMGGFDQRSLSGVVNVDMDFNDAGGGTAQIRKARIEIWRVV